MSATIKALFDDVKSADSEAASVSADKAVKARELSALESRERLATMRQRETRTRLQDALKPDKPYRLDDTHIVRKTNGKLVVEELQDPEKESVVTPSIHEDSTLVLLWQGVLLGFKKSAMPAIAVGVLLFGGVSLVGYLNGRPDDNPPAPAPDDPSLSDLAKQLKRAITSNLDRDKTTSAEAVKLAANFDTVSSEISQAVAGAGHEELKDPAKIEARIAALNQASVDNARWKSVFAQFAQVATDVDKAGNLASSSDYIPLFNATSQALRAFARGK